MATACDIDTTSPEALCEWLNDGTVPADLTPETTRPWAQTFRVNAEPRDRFLKVLPVVQTGALRALPLLSQLFPEVVPNVRAVDASRGLVLLDHHGGVGLDRGSDAEPRQALLLTYAKLQAKAARQEELLARLPSVALDELVPTLLSFFDPNFSGELPSGPARAKDFFDAERCLYYFELFTARAEALANLIRLANSLPLTINHCDLRSANAARKENGDVVIYDWDEAVAGPAGMSLHNFFSGCSTPCDILRNPASTLPEDRDEACKLLGCYLNTLTAGGYCDTATLSRGLPGAICAGVINYLLSYGKFIPTDDDYREVVGDILRRRLNDLLVLADILHEESPEATLQIVADYERRERRDHACRVLARYVERNPNDAAAAANLATLLSHSDNRDVAPEIFERLLNRHPESGVIQRLCGFRLLEALDFDGAIFHLTQAIRFGVSDEAVDRALKEAVEYREVCIHARRSGQIPTIHVSAEEQACGEMRPVRRRLAVRLFREYGTLLIENAFPTELVGRMHQEYMDRYQRYFVRASHADALRVGSKRYMVTVDLDGAFHSPTVYANPNVAPIIRDVLNDEMIMGGFVSVCSLPGSDHMRVHKDHPALFTEMADPDKLPSFAVTAIVPLRGFTKELGTTRVVKGSHRVSSEVAEEMESQDPLAPPGSCLLMDYRLTHQGRANESEDQVRPILTMIYHRPWFRDIVNYGIQDPILMTDEAFERIPEEHRPLFDWSRRKTGC
jgi:tetratricopeptide (TPR) repeat protein